MAWGDTLLVPSEFPTIQSAIDAAEDGDTVRVLPGVYNEIVTFLGKAIVVESAEGPSTTVIDGTGFLLSGLVRFRDSEGPDSVLRGFMIRNMDGGAENDRR